MDQGRSATGGPGAHPWGVASVGAGLVGVTTWLDAVLPPDLELDLFYFVPIAVVGWWCGARLAAAIAVLATAGNLAAASSAREMVLLPLLWDVPTRLVMFGGVGVLMWQLRRRHDEVAALALRDALTGLANRRLLLDRIERAIAAAQRGTEAAVLAVDLDGFKQVNDRYGHQAGDDVLRQVASRLETCVRLGDTVARVGGDEFVVLLPQTGVTEAGAIRERIAAAMTAEFRLGDRPLPLGASIGLALCPRDGATVEALLAAADARMYAAKSGLPSVTPVPGAS